MMRLLAPLLCLWATACVQYTGASWTVYPHQGRAVLALRDLRGEPGDLSTLVVRWVDGPVLQERFPNAHVGTRITRERRDALDLIVLIDFESPHDIGVGAWDTARPYRYCAPSGEQIVTTNARWRDADGCAVWPRSARVLRVDTRVIGGAGGSSLLPAWLEWRAAGSPAFDTVE